jgi:hypothetical protein
MKNRKKIDELNFKTAKNKAFFHFELIQNVI